ncbi:MAG TPA: hypothetical protein VIL20_04155 [Sandaracinaceae bacterium]
MLKRLGLGLLKGLLIGGAIGAGLQYGLPELFPNVTWEFGGVFAYLAAMGVAGTTGIFAGKPPWHEGAWIEAALKGIVGVGLGALAYWVASKWASFSAFEMPGVPAAAKWTELPVLYAPAIAGVYGSLVELDNTGDEGSASKGRKGPKARVAVEDEVELVDEGAPTKKRQRRA